MMNDIGAHQASVDSVNDAGKEVISSEGGAEATSTRRKLDDLNNMWEKVLTKTRDRQIELQDALREVSPNSMSFHQVAFQYQSLEYTADFINQQFIIMDI